MSADPALDVILLQLQLPNSLFAIFDFSMTHYRIRLRALIFIKMLDIGLPGS
jgi:hypothetical protein